MIKENINWERKLTITEFNNLKEVIKNKAGEYHFSNIRGIVNYEPTENEILNSIESLMQNNNTQAKGDRRMFLLYDTAFNIFTNSILSKCFIDEDKIDKKLYDNIFGFPCQKQYYFLICRDKKDCLYMFDLSTSENLMEYAEGKYRKLIAGTRENTEKTKLQELVERYVVI